MYSISFRNAPKGNLKALRSATNWALERLLGKRIAETVDVRVKFVDNLLSKELTYGDLEDHGDRFYTIRIDNGGSLTRLQVFRTLMHELVHLKQYVKGELHDYCYNINMVRWKRSKIDVMKTDYINQPWEKEAYKMQKILTKQWAQEENYSQFLRKRH